MKVKGLVNSHDTRCAVRNICSTITGNTNLRVTRELRRGGPQSGEGYEAWRSSGRRNKIGIQYS